MKNIKIFLTLCTIAIGATRVSAALPRVEFLVSASNVDGAEISLTHREQARIERFLAHVFPIRQMRREAECWQSPNYRNVTYSVISQEGFRFVLASYNAEWKQGERMKQGVNILAIYRIEDGGPNQVWRGRPWMATYDGLHFSSAKAIASGSAIAKSRAEKNIVLFQEGGSSGFGLASVFSFHNELHGLVIRDLTPTLPCLRASTRFPFRPLYGRQIGLRANVGERHDLILLANDEEFNISNRKVVDEGWSPDFRWRYKHGRFEPWNVRSYIISSEIGNKN